MVSEGQIGRTSYNPMQTHFCVIDTLMHQGLSFGREALKGAARLAWTVSAAVGVTERASLLWYACQRSG